MSLRSNRNYYASCRRKSCGIFFVLRAVMVTLRRERGKDKPSVRRAITRKIYVQTICGSNL